MLKKLSATVATLALCMAAAGPAAAQAPAPSPQYNARIGWVSTERLFTESKLAHAADAKIEAEFSKRQKTLQDLADTVKKASQQLDADTPKLSEAERTKRTRELLDMDKDLQRKDREFREDLMQRKNEERAAISQRAYKFIVQIAQEEKLDVVLADSVWFNPRIDITDKILKMLDK
ncbi:MAG: OmpH family outer membrane protein [Telluria sp.]|jgi:outer membrane protein